MLNFSFFLSNIAFIENLTEIKPTISELLIEKTDFYDWILKRIKRPGFDSNKQYCSEILAVTLQTSKGIMNSFFKIN